MTSNSISGIVRDEGNQEVANATVALIKQNGGSIVEYTQTDSNGFYEFFFHQDADATEENWHVAVYDQDSPIFNSFSKPYVSAALNLGIGKIDSTSTLGGLPTANGLLSVSSQYTGISPNSTSLFQLPVAYNNLVAWYPFDSGEYGGANADDVTAIEGGSGDDTAYDGTVNGATYQSSAGVTDINAGANSGAFRFNEFDFIDCGSAVDSTNPITVTAWAKADNIPDFARLVNANDNTNGYRIMILNGDNIEFITEDGGNRQEVTTGLPTVGEWVHYAGVFTGSQNILYIDGQSVGSNSSSGSGSDPVTFRIGNGDPTDNDQGWEGDIDDVRVYNTGLTANQVNQIYQNTQP